MTAMTPSSKTAPPDPRRCLPLPALLLALCACSAAPPDGATAPSPAAPAMRKAPAPLIVETWPQPCDETPAVCDEQAQKRAELLKARRDRIHPAGETPPIILPKPEQ